MRRFTRRRFRRTVAGPYSREGTRFAITLAQAQGMWQSYSTIVPPIEAQGNRKVKNMLVSVGLRSISYPVCYTLYYVPQLINPTGFLGPTASTWDVAHNTWAGNWSSTYEPNQNVLASGLVTLAQPVKVYWSGMRTLNSGDRIVLALHSVVPDAAQDPNGAAVIDARYAIAYS